MSPAANRPSEPPRPDPPDGIGWADLHSHSLISDGVLSPELLVARAAAAGVRVLALTDHDTVAGVARARAAAPAELEVLPGIEISAHHGERDVHVLGYFAPSRLEDWEGFQRLRREARLERFERILDRLDELGAPVDRAEVHAERARDPQRVPGRPHLARALIRAGHVADMEEAFQRFLGQGRPAHVPTRGPDVPQAIEQIHARGGLAVVAHPTYGDLGACLAEFRAAGLDGVEAYHFGHDAEQAAHFEGLASELGLLVTGGSDFHGLAEDPEGERAGERLGQARLPRARFLAFAATLAERSGWELRLPD